MSFAPAGSVAVPVTAIDVPSTRVAPMLTMVGLGFTLATLIVCEAVLLPPSSSLAVSRIS